MVGCTSQSGEANPGLRGLYLQTMLSEISEISRTYEARPGVSSKRRALALRAKAGPSMLFLIGQGRRRLYSVATHNSMCDCTIAFDIESLHAPPPRQPTAIRAHPTAPSPRPPTSMHFQHCQTPASSQPEKNEFHHGLGCSGARAIFTKCRRWVYWPFTTQL